MKTQIFTLFLILLVAGPTKTDAQVRRPDERLGKGIVELSMDRESDALISFRLSGSQNSLALLERIEDPGTTYRYHFDYDDPTLNGFYDYLVYISKKQQYKFLAEVVREFDRRKPSRELGELGPFFNAYFSPRSTYLIIYSLFRTIIIESQTGKVIINHNLKAENIEEVQYIFSKDEKQVIKYVQTSYSKDVPKIITYEDFLSKKIIWTKKMTDRVMTGFSKDYSKIILFNFKGGSDQINVVMHEIDRNTGKELRKKSLGELPSDQIDPEFAKITSTNVDLFPDHRVDVVKCPNNKYFFEGNKTFGNYTLKSISDNREIKKFRFDSGIE